jgi:hypothetical protein
VQASGVGGLVGYGWEALSTPPRPFTLIFGTNSRVAMPWSLGMAGLLHAFRRDFRKSASFESR